MKQAATAADRRRYDRLQTIGCIACRMEGCGYAQVDIHHLTSTGRHGGERRGNRFTVGLCPWHHRGVVPTGMLLTDCEEMRGPSLKHTPRAFREKYGEDAALLAYQDKILRIRYGCAAAPPIEE